MNGHDQPRSGSTDPDWSVRLAAFAALEKLTRATGGVLPWAAIEQGFEHQGRSYLFANQSKGIFRPSGMQGAALSVKSTVPRQGVPKYADVAHGAAFTYALQSRGLEYHDNVLLLHAEQLRTPIIYFFGVTPGHYRPLWPMYVTDVDRVAQTVRLVASTSDEILVPGAHVADAIMMRAERRYATVEVKKRLHQDIFRHIVLAAYANRCAVCGLPRKELLDAAHIQPDCDVRGEPVVNNGLALCKLHHGAYDADLLGVRPDHVIEIARRLKETRDGPTLELGLKAFDGKAIVLPKRTQDRPLADHLDARYQAFRRTA